MRKHLKHVFAFLSLNIFICALPYTTLANIPQNRIKDISVTESKDEFSILIDFSASQIKRTAPLFFKKSIQLDIESSSIDTKKTIPVKNDFLKEIQIYYFSPGVVRTRLYLAKEGLDIKKGFHITEKESALLITINKKEAGLIKAKPQKPVKILDEKILNLIATSSEITRPEETEEIESDSKPAAVEAKSEDNLAKVSEVIKSEEIKKSEEPTQKNADVNSADNKEILPAIQEKEVLASSASSLTLNTLSGEVNDSNLQSKMTTRKQGAADESTALNINLNETEKKAGSIIEGGIGDLLPSLMKMGGALLIVLALIFFSAAGAKKVLSKNDTLLGNNKLIKILASSHIGVKKNILLVEVAGEMLVLGVSNDNITMLTKVEADERTNLPHKATNQEKSTSPTLFSLKNYFSGSKENKKEFSELIDKAIDKKTAKHESVKEKDQRSELIASVAKSIRKQAEMLKNG